MKEERIAKEFHVNEKYDDDNSSSKMDTIEMNDSGFDSFIEEREELEHDEEEKRSKIFEESEDDEKMKKDENDDQIDARIENDDDNSLTFHRGAEHGNPYKSGPCREKGRLWAPTKPNYGASTNQCNLQ